MAKTEESRYDVLTKKQEVSSYDNKIIKRSVSDRILKSPKFTSFLVYYDKIIQHWFETTRLIKLQINYRLDKNSKSIDN